MRATACRGQGWAALLTGLALGVAAAQLTAPTAPPPPAAPTGPAAPATGTTTPKPEQPRLSSEALYAEYQTAKLLLSFELTRAQGQALLARLPDVAAAATMVAEIEQRYFAEIGPAAQAMETALLHGEPVTDQTRFEGRRIQDRYTPLRSATEQQYTAAVAAVEALLSPKQRALVESEEQSLARQLRDDPNVRVNRSAVDQAVNEAGTWVLQASPQSYRQERFARALAVAQSAWPGLGPAGQQALALRLAAWFDTLRVPGAQPPAPAEVRGQLAELLFPTVVRVEGQTVVPRSRWLTMLKNARTVALLQALLPRLPGAVQ